MGSRSYDVNTYKSNGRQNLRPNQERPMELRTIKRRLSQVPSSGHSPTGTFEPVDPEKVKKYEKQKIENLPAKEAPNGDAAEFYPPEFAPTKKRGKCYGCLLGNLILILTLLILAAVGIGLYYGLLLPKIRLSEIEEKIAVPPTLPLASSTLRTILTSTIVVPTTSGTYVTQSKSSSKRVTPVDTTSTTTQSTIRTTQTTTVATSTTEASSSVIVIKTSTTNMQTYSYLLSTQQTSTKTSVAPSTTKELDVHTTSATMSSTMETSMPMTSVIPSTTMDMDIPMNSSIPSATMGRSMPTTSGTLSTSMETSMHVASVISSTTMEMAMSTISATPSTTMEMSMPMTSAISSTTMEMDMPTISATSSTTMETGVSKTNISSTIIEMGVPDLSTTPVSTMTSVLTSFTQFPPVSTGAISTAHNIDHATTAQTVEIMPTIQNLQNSTFLFDGEENITQNVQDPENITTVPNTESSLITLFTSEENATILNEEYSTKIASVNLATELSDSENDTAINTTETKFSTQHLVTESSLFSTESNNATKFEIADNETYEVTTKSSTQHFPESHTTKYEHAVVNMNASDDVFTSTAIENETMANLSTDPTEIQNSTFDNETLLDSKLFSPTEFNILNENGSTSDLYVSETIAQATSDDNSILVTETYLAFEIKNDTSEIPHPSLLHENITHDNESDNATAHLVIINVTDADNIALLNDNTTDNITISPKIGTKPTLANPDEAVDDRSKVEGKSNEILDDEYESENTNVKATTGGHTEEQFVYSDDDYDDPSLFESGY